MSALDAPSLEALESLTWAGLVPDDRERIERIGRELELGFRSLADVEPAIACFGSARAAETSPACIEARAVARAAAETGFNVITGGGPGVMEAANRGCVEGGGLSVGLSIRLPEEQATNAFVQRECAFHYFFVRKLMFVRHSCAFLIFPGGFGTLDETFEALTLVQTHKVPHFPVLLFGGSYWSGLMRQLDEMTAHGAISADERARVRPVAGVEPALAILRASHERLCAAGQKPPLRIRSAGALP